jgi:hypothetical protein
VFLQVCGHQLDPCVDEQPSEEYFKQENTWSLS